MERDFQKGRIAIDFSAAPFDSAAGLLRRSAVLFAGTLPYIAAITLAVFVPGKLLTQLIAWAFDVPPAGILSYLLLDISDLVLGALAIPAVVYGLAGKLRTGRTPPVAEALRWGRRLWPRMLWNRFKVEITVTLWSLLIFVPGLIAMVRLALTEAALSIEGVRAADPLERSRELTAGHRWRIFCALAPLWALDMVAGLAAPGVLSRAEHPRWMAALADSAMAVVGQWSTVAAMLIYLGLARAYRQPR